MDRVCGHLDSLVRGRYLLFNNLWGAETGSGEQCLSTEAPDTAEPLAWETSWRWDGDSNTVKSYVAAVVGWHFGWPAPAWELPVALSSLAALPSRWDYDLEASAASRLNVAYDIWLARTPEAPPQDITDEVMIWLHRAGDPTPIGRPTRAVEVEGARWQLWEGPHPSRAWTVHSFVRSGSARDAATRLDLRRFFDPISDITPEAHYLAGVQAGAEIFTGTGTLRTTAYSLEVIPVVPPVDTSG